jgi:hypothetical protein
MTQLFRHRLEAIERQLQSGFEFRVGAFFESDPKWTRPPSYYTGSTHCTRAKRGVLKAALAEFFEMAKMATTTRRRMQFTVFMVGGSNLVYNIVVKE